MFIEFDAASGPILLNVRHIVLVKRSSSDGTEIVFANGGNAIVTAPYQEVCDSIGTSLRALAAVSMEGQPGDAPGMSHDTGNFEIFITHGALLLYETPR
jgi:hypothetical protein